MLTDSATVLSEFVSSVATESLAFDLTSLRHFDFILNAKSIIYLMTTLYSIPLLECLQPRSPIH